VEIWRINVQVHPGQKVSEISSQPTSWAMKAHVCGPSYEEGTSRRIVIQAKLGKRKKKEKKRKKQDHKMPHH
jgi:hypothetical protein